MFFERSNKSWVVHAPAKINLALEVLGRQADGYHQLETLLVPLRLFDTLVYKPSPDPFRLRVVGSPGCSFESLSVNADENLVTKAVRLLATAAGREPTGEMTLWKRIPLEAGLGGGSSDAAAALETVNRSWKTGYGKNRLQELARQLGSDVPFFLEGGAALGTGRGEILTRVPNPPSMPVILMKPAVGLSTPRVFESLGLSRGEPAGNSGGRCQRMLEQLRHSRSLVSWKHLAGNDLQIAAAKLCHCIDKLAATFDRLPVLMHQMTGSGSGYFAVCRTWRDARSIASRLRGLDGQWALATSTGS